MNADQLKLRILLIGLVAEMLRSQAADDPRLAGALAELKRQQANLADQIGEEVVEFDERAAAREGAETIEEFADEDLRWGVESDVVVRMQPLRMEAKHG